MAPTSYLIELWGVCDNYESEAASLLTNLSDLLLDGERVQAMCKTTISSAHFELEISYDDEKGRLVAKLVCDFEHPAGGQLPCPDKRVFKNLLRGAHCSRRLLA